ncbi:hypothetical protein XBKB1_1240036 [Xenorhabdus bovienii str. kraussei Becker Underwood]|uniref:Uncharacterized protein n=1 Tax=Xenorhabdus bovienii str. kraussei Becker Underwood TaxID=1398204 RepID=A0A077PRW6_XENBV|nr:hypothetical protein XBKB1_1240036 [Xenorhabdus bovienii str. kraussei Becker Underwood]
MDKTCLMDILNSPGLRQPDRTMQEGCHFILKGHFWMINFYKTGVA